MSATYYTILYYTILYYTILYYTILYYTIPYYTILYYTILYYTILYYTILYYIHYTLYTIHYTLYTIHYILYTIYYILYTIYYILYYTILYKIPQDSGMPASTAAATWTRIPPSPSGHLGLAPGRFPREDSGAPRQPRDSPLKGSFKGDNDIGTGVDVDMNIARDMAVSIDCGVFEKELRASLKWIWG